MPPKVVGHLSDIVTVKISVRQQLGGEVHIKHTGPGCFLMKTTMTFEK